MKHGRLQTILNQYKDLTYLKDNLEMEINSINKNIKTIEQENENYGNKIKKVRNAKKDLKLYNTMFLIFLIIISILMFQNYSLFNLMCSLGVTVVYLGVISSDVKTVIANNVKKISAEYYKNIDTLNSLKEKEKNLREELKVCKTNQNSSEQFLENIILDADKILSEKTVAEIPVIPEVSINQDKELKKIKK